MYLALKLKIFYYMNFLFWKHINPPIDLIHD